MYAPGSAIHVLHLNVEHCSLRPNIVLPILELFLRRESASIDDTAVCPDDLY